jgi:hypothetical protein
MSLTKEQKKELERLSEQFRKMEQISTSSNVDLDVYMSDYKEDGFEVYATERISLKDQVKKRKAILEKAETEKSKSARKNH